MKKQLFFYVLFLPIFICAQEYTTFRPNVFDPAGVEGDIFGSAAALSADGNRIAVASSFHDGATGSETDIGKVSIYEFDGTNWVKLGSDLVGLMAGDSFGINISMNAAGTIVAIGTDRGDPNGTSSGYVQVFEYNGSSWVQQGATFEGQSAGESLGSDVSLNSDGTRLAIGSSGANTAAGEVKVYSYDGSGWSQIGSTLSGSSENDRFGASLDLDDTGNFLVVGAPTVDSNGTADGQDRGQVYGYEFITDWTNNFIATGLAANDNFGYNVEISGNNGVLAASARQGNNFDPSNGAGYVRTYFSNGSGYTNFRDIFGLSANDRFGRSLAFSNDGMFLAISASAITSSSPKVYLYKRGFASGINDWDLQPGEYDDSEDAGNGSSLCLTDAGNILFTSAFVPDPNGVNGVIKSYADPSTLTVQNYESESKFQVYPNPTASILHLNSNSQINIERIKVIDITGKIYIDEDVIAQNNLRIDISNLANGKYILEILTETDRKMFKVIKN